MTQTTAQDSIISPLAKAKGTGSAHHGAGHWMHQRITALANIPLMFWLVWSVVHMQGWDYQTVTVWLAEPANSILMILAVLSVFYHAALGLQVVIEDYVSCACKRLLSVILVRLVLAALGVAAIFSVLKVSLAG